MLSSTSLLQCQDVSPGNICSETQINLFTIFFFQLSSQCLDDLKFCMHSLFLTSHDTALLTFYLFPCFNPMDSKAKSNYVSFQVSQSMQSSALTVSVSAA